MERVTLTIDGQQVTVEKGKTVLQAAIEAGDLILADHWANVIELQEATRGHDPEHVTVFESLGIAVEDCAAAAYVYEQALARGMGSRM